MWAQRASLYDPCSLTSSPWLSLPYTCYIHIEVLLFFRHAQLPLASCTLHVVLSLPGSPPINLIGSNLSFSSLLRHNYPSWSPSSFLTSPVWVRCPCHTLQNYPTLRSIIELICTSFLILEVITYLFPHIFLLASNPWWKLLFVLKVLVRRASLVAQKVKNLPVLVYWLVISKDLINFFDK